MPLAILFAGCGSTNRTSNQGGGGGEPPAGEPAEAVCDGTARLRVRFFMPGAPGREVRGSAVEAENGFPSFFVDGQCNYWISPAWTNAEPGVDSRDLGWRFGRVDIGLEADLNTLPLKHLDSLGDCVANSFFDKSPATISDETSGASCVDSGPRHQAAFDMVRSRSSELWAGGAALTSGLWLSAVPASGGDTSKAYEWPGTELLSLFVLPADSWSRRGVGRLVSDVGVAASLRALRVSYVEDRKLTPGYFFDGMKMTDGATEALVYMRDQLPYENEVGLLPFAGPQ